MLSDLWFVLKIAALMALWGLLMALAGKRVVAAPACSVKAQPAVSAEPLRYLRVNTVVERDPANARIELGLFGPEGEVTTAMLWERGWTDHPRTRQVEWKNLNEPAGEYQVVLLVSRGDGGSCRSVARVIVG